MMEKQSHLVILTALVVFSASLAAECGGSCTYYASGSNTLVTWNMDTTCNGKNFDHPSAFAQSGSVTYLCGSSLTSCSMSSQAGWMSWTSTTARPTLSGAYVQGLYRDVSGSITAGNQIFCTSASGGSGGGTQPACASVKVSLNGPNGLPSGSFYGYNWTQSWLDSSHGGIPSLFVSAQCYDAASNPMPCGDSVQWTTTKGTLHADAVSQLASNQIWQSSNTPGPVSITATVSGCSTPTASASFYLHILDSCGLNPTSTALDAGASQVFSGTCYDETRQGRPCDYPLVTHANPDAIGSISQNTEPTGIPPDNNPPVGERPARIWLDSTVRFNANYVDAAGMLSGAGPTFSCNAPITVGNPATACTLTLSSSSVQAGKTIQATPSCTGPRGPAECPDMDFWAGPAAVVSWSNYTAANVSGTYAGTATVHAVYAPRQTCTQDASINVFNLDTPVITTCTYVPHEASANLDLPADATNIRAYLAGGGTDDGCTKVDVNGQRVFDEGCDAGYRSASCGNYVIAHDLSLPAPVRLPLHAGANTVTGRNIDTFGQYATLTLRVAGTYQVNQCPAGTQVPMTPFSCQADLTVTPGTTCTTPPRAQSFNTESTRFDQLQSDQLQNVPNMVLARSDFRLQYASDVFACGQDFDGGIRSSPGFIAVDAARMHDSIAHPIQPVIVTLRNIAGNNAPRVFVLDEFAQQASDVLQRGSDCASLNRCTNVRFDPLAHTLTFQAPGFSSYAAQGATGPDVSGDDAEFLTQTPPPTAMQPGQTASVSVTLRNNGTSTWLDCVSATECGVYRLSFTQDAQVVPQSDPTYNTWGTNPVFMAPADSTPPGASKTFIFPITAPASEGTYRFQWRMARKENGFGQSSPSLDIQVSTNAASPSPTTSPTPTVTPTSSPSATPPVPPTPTPTIGPVSRPEAFVRLACPAQLIIATRVSIQAESQSFGQPACTPSVLLNLTAPNGESVEAESLGCTNGLTAFSVNTTQDGTWRASADYNESTDSCLFAVTGTPPQATPELDPAVILIATMLAAAVAYGRRNHA